MRLVILAAGISSRMKKSDSVPEQLDQKLLHDASARTKSMIRIGEGDRPFLDYVLYNIREAGYRDIVIVIGRDDSSIRERYGSIDRDNEFHGLTISYAIQAIPAGREKPFGTADALLHALSMRPDWSGHQFTVCNSDNLYSVRALSILLDSPYPNAMIDYDRDSLEFDRNRIEKFAITKKDHQHFLVDIIEKPTPEQLVQVRDDRGVIGVSMNIFYLSYDMVKPFLELVPLHPVRSEKELPAAIKMMVARYPGSLYAYPLSEHVPDLSSKSDMLAVRDYLQKHYPDFTFE